MVWGTFGLGWGGRANRGGRGGWYKRVGGYPLHNSLLPPCSKAELTQSDLNTVLLRWPGVTQWPLGLLRSRFIGPLRSTHMEYTGNGIQNWFLKEIEWIIYYVKRPLQGLLKEIPEIHLFSPWIGNTCLCIAYDIAFTVQAINLKRIVNKCF